MFKRSIKFEPWLGAHLSDAGFRSLVCQFSFPITSCYLSSYAINNMAKIFKHFSNQKQQNNRLGGGGGRYRRLTRLWWDWLVQNMKSERWRKKCNQVKLQNQFNHTCSHLLTPWSFKPAGLSFCFGTQNVNSCVIIIIIIYFFFNTSI